MLHYLYIFIFAMLFSVALTPAMKWLSVKWKVLDLPGRRKIHEKPIPLMGGEAIICSIILALAIFEPANQQLWVVILFGLLFALFGFIDDGVARMRARYKIVIHLIFSFAFIYFTGIHLHFFRFAWINWILTAGFITFMANSMNMLDGMDALVGGVSFFAAGFFGILAWNSGQPDLIILAAALMGAALGFLNFNFSPASIFLGEAGSTMLGYFMAILAVKINIYELWNIALGLGLARLQFISFIVPLIILGIPIFDTYFVFVSRFTHHRRFSQAGKDHSHHRIHMMGVSKRTTVLSLYALQLILGAIALVMAQSNLQQFLALLSIVGIFFVGFTAFLVRVRVY
jgi:UDP-GlcNAc:undecaprenyl-phosphate GlcNAc-1-phosphate transferase